MAEVSIAFSAISSLSDSLIGLTDTDTHLKYWPVKPPSLWWRKIVGEIVANLKRMAFF